MSLLKNLTHRALFPNLLSCTKRFTSSVIENTVGDSTSENDNEPIPPLIGRELKLLPKYTKPRECWVENFDKVKEEKRGLIQLHPQIFGTMPRLDMIYDNVRWQRMYKKVTFHQAPSRAECPGGGRKPWPQKGTGRARHGSIRAPQWKNGGSAHGPRNPTSYFYRLAYQKRIMGLTSTLSVKLAQDDLKIVDNINIPTEESSFITDLMEERHWGLSVLIVDTLDLMPRNLTIATENLPFVTYMPVYGLNVYSMIKHETVVLTVDAVNEIEDKLLKLLHTNDERMCSKKYTMFKEGCGMPY